MTDTLTQDAPAPAKPRRTLSPEHLAKLKAGRDAKAAKKKAPSANTNAPASAEVADLRAELAAAKAENERIRKAAGILTPDEIKALPTERVFYDFTADKKKEPHGEPVGEQIVDLDSPRWAELMGLRMAIVGQIVVQKIHRAKSGEILSYEDVSCVQARSPQMARDMMRARLANPVAWY